MPGQQDGVGLGALRLALAPGIASGGRGCDARVMRMLILLSLAVATAASAAERKLFVSSFDRLRVDGPFRVDVVTGRSPAGRITGDPRQLDGVEVRQEGDTLVVRRTSARDEELPRGDGAQPVIVTLATPTLAGAYLVGTGALSIAGMTGDRIDLSIAGAGTIGVTGADAAALNATSIGTGRITIAGRAASARLLVNGAGGVQADKLDAGELTVRLEGPGEIVARARYNAAVTNTGLGRIAVAGSPKCMVKAVTSGSVTCGGPMRPRP